MPSTRVSINKSWVVLCMCAGILQIKSSDTLILNGAFSRQLIICFTLRLYGFLQIKTTIAFKCVAKVIMKSSETKDKVNLTQIKTTFFLNSQI